MAAVLAAIVLVRVVLRVLLRVLNSELEQLWQQQSVLNSKLEAWRSNGLLFVLPLLAHHHQEELERLLDPELAGRQDVWKEEGALSLPLPLPLRLPPPLPLPTPAHTQTPTPTSW